MRSQFVAQLLLPIKIAIQEVEGDVVPISVVPRVWQVLRFRLQRVADQMCNSSLLNSSEIAELMSCVDKRIEMNQKTVHSAAALLDPRFQSLDLGMSDESVAAAENLIITLARDQKIEQVHILDDLAQYRARQGPYCATARSHIWSHASSFQIDPCMWWCSYAMGRPLFKIATILLSLPCTTAAVERGNKAYSLQKTKKRNRLTDERSATLTSISFNLTLNTDTTEPGTGGHRKVKLYHALMMPTSADDNASKARLIYDYFNILV